MDDIPPIWRQFAIQLRDNMALLVMALLILAAALLTDIDPTVATILWALALGAAVLRVFTRRPHLAEPKEDANGAKPETDPIEMIAAGAEALDMPVVILRDDSTVVSQNRAAERSFGPVTAGLHVSARWRSPGILDMIRETIATGEPNQIEHSERLPSERVYIVRIAPVEMPEGGAEQRLFLLSFRDISDLRRLDRMRSDFVANASHELRTPLASLRGFLETLQGPARNDPKAQERFVAIMLDQVNRMSRLVDDLLSLSRLELKAHLAPDETVSLGPVLGHVLDSLSPLAAELDVEVRLHLPDRKVEVVGDRDELIQVFENLIENACKYGQEGKRVDVHVRGGDAGKPVEVSIVDHGPGIPAEHVPRLTERFYRVSVADSRSKKGTGLGLAIVKHILTRHRARLIVKSELGKGTDFTVRF
ncbi:phosphate regulon sensor histidine kinase PhoR [Pseudomonas sp. R2.Fl]|nr:phosphate regulon sensor histidine kinase PhoR [Pseudomonas sp. R2.Fl]